MQVRKIMKRDYGLTDADFWQLDIGDAKPLLFMNPAHSGSLAEAASTRKSYKNWFNSSHVATFSVSKGMVSMILKPYGRCLQNLVSWKETKRELLRTGTAGTRSSFSGGKIGNRCIFLEAPFYSSSLNGSEYICKWRSYEGHTDVTYDRRMVYSTDNSWTETCVYWPTPSYYITTAHPYNGTATCGGNHAPFTFSIPISPSTTAQAVPDATPYTQYEGWVLVEGPTLVGNLEVVIDLWTGEIAMINIVAASTVANKIEYYASTLPENVPTTDLNNKILELRSQPNLRIGVVSNKGDTFIKTDPRLSPMLAAIKATDGVVNGIDLTAANAYFAKTTGFQTFTFSVGSNVDDSIAPRQTINIASIPSVQDDTTPTYSLSIVNGSTSVYYGDADLLAALQQYADAGDLMVLDDSIPDELGATIVGLLPAYASGMSSGDMPTNRFGTVLLTNVGAVDYKENHFLSALLLYPNILQEAV